MQTMGLVEGSTHWLRGSIGVCQDVGDVAPLVVDVWDQKMLHMEVQQWWKTQLRGSRGCSASHLVPHQEESSQHILWINT